MLRNAFHGIPGSGGGDVTALGGNMRRKTLMITFNGSGTLLVALGKSTQGGTVFDFSTSNTGAPLILSREMVGDAITDDVHIWNSTGSGPAGVIEFFDP